jgi:hypothetical protein
MRKPIEVLVKFLALLFLIPVSFAQNSLNGSDISVPMAGGGEIALEGVKFIRTDQFNLNYPELTFRMINHAKGAWESQDIAFDMWGICKDGIRHWSDRLTVDSSRPAFSLPGATPGKSSVSSDQPFSRRYTHVVESLASGFQLQGCGTVIVRARRVSDLPLPDPTEDEVRAAQKELRIREEAVETETQKEAAREAEEERIKAEREQRRLQGAADKELIRNITFCHLVYRNTANKKISDLTVKEEQQVRACQAAELYH